ncbi:hypothetical protein JR316_0011764 [Psilocybe cubensis]|uniref:Uncharacterized protein n=2 Tax=Psilocybe cubensis TaxID=181762 RepID=A0ACB8GKI3_PSICU|nr:hypothetical protein JR316_0011764 [Psilocybe cubensis]KAH9476193.1 hypothetical protein JR316_0011764 [Psilocybe cubensis]
MDFMSPAFDQESLSEDEISVGTVAQNYVKWQSSQSHNPALNQLIKSSAKDPIYSKENFSSSRVWQRQSSFEQIPGFSLLTTSDHSVPPVSSASASSSKPLSSSRPLTSRTRPSEYKARRKSSTVEAPSTDSSVSSTIPFLDKTNPTAFLDILKGVSARVEANVGLRSRGSVLDPFHPSRIEKAKKRVRDGSVGSSAEAQSLKAKKVRIESLRQVMDKGKGRAADEEDLEGSERSYMLSIGSTSRTTSTASKSLSDGSFMDVDDCDKSMADSHADTASPLLSRPGLTKTPSQAKMPPPPAPMTKHPTVSNITPSRISTSLYSSSSQLSKSCHKLPQQDHNGHGSRPPKYHPLLLQQQATTTTSSEHSQARNDVLQPQPIAVKTSSINETPKAESRYDSSAMDVETIFPSSTPLAGSQQVRPPALGMRRTHTFPASGMVPSMQKSGVLPTKQKGFKPPLLPSSQPQSSTSNSSASGTKGSTSSVGHNQPQNQPHRTHYATSRAPSGGSNSSTSSSDSPTARVHSSSSSFSTSTSTSFNTSTPISSSSSSSHKTRPRTPASIAREEAIAKALAEAAGTAQAPPRNRGPHPQPQSRSRAVAPPPAPAYKAAPAHHPPLPPQPVRAAEPVAIPAPASPVLPEPANGDGDSSFGDMSFDMDALEETMRQYD